MLKLKNVSFGYNDKPVLKKINLNIAVGDHVSLIGESGCGKSTLLQLIYGLHHTDGFVSWNGIELGGPNHNLVPGEDFIKYLAQDFDLMPPLTVSENVGKHLSNAYPRKKKKRIMELLEVVEMTELADAKAGDLSGGQQQRVALARALANTPELLLLDEPFSHIDHFRKNNLRRKLFAYLKENKITCIIATHDSTDALSFADKTIVLKNGKIYANDAPQEIYNNPPNKYIASLFGDINEVMLKSITPNETSLKMILLYPHEIRLDKNSGIKVVVLASYFKGSNFLIKASLKNKIIYFENSKALMIGESVFITVDKNLIKSRTRN
ncbi:ABC-type Fe3+/spermidine/putrescine transport system ATPase subunit [Gillisia mitskevichiae]|uniref:ABC-type Fe3+/spermidine/putrescine transport system ATPase subunit n=1 Tax=Gillisia mitskevichiae TaxID=270921 RepID=A0A495PY31_9FLAO|nr:ABC transporter ATP-binding protein [Gillisia mitskevichiae]RKS55336.1 ABC-type Fe3+/spermidine/putrescine transport system ATPase subunit [Gillisia mitskevichiae]